MRVYLTGGTGFIGRQLVPELRTAGHTPVVATRNVERGRTTLGESVEVVEGSDTEAVQAALGAVDAIVNLAGEPVLPARWTHEKKRRLVESRVDRTSELVDQLGGLQSKPTVLVSASAVGYYGTDAGSTPRPEDAPPADDFLARLCVDWEAAARKAEAFGVRVVRIRIGLVLGEGGGALKQLVTPFKLGAGGRIGSGEQYMPWIHVRDVTSMIRAALDDENFPAVVNATAPHPVTNAAFTAALGKVLGRWTPFPVPGFALRAALGEAASALLGGQNAVPAAALDHGFQFEFTDLEACLAEILRR